MIDIIMTVNEGSSGNYLTASFTDADGNPATPASIYYSIWDKNSRAVVRGQTPVTPDTSVTVFLEGDDTKLIGSGDYEIRLFDLIVTDTAGNEITKEAAYKVNGLAGV